MRFIVLQRLMSIKIDRYFINKGSGKDKCKLCFGFLEKNPWKSPEFGNLICRHCAFAEKSRIRNNNKRKRNKRIPTGKIFFSEWLSVLEKHNFACAACQATNRKKLTIDHVIPLVHGGKNVHSNVQPLCVACHEYKDGHRPTIGSIKNRYIKKFRKLMWEKFGISFPKKNIKF